MTIERAALSWPNLRLPDFFFLYNRFHGIYALNVILKRVHDIFCPLRWVPGPSSAFVYSLAQNRESAVAASCCAPRVATTTVDCARATACRNPVLSLQCIRANSQRPNFDLFTLLDLPPTNAGQHTLLGFLLPRYPAAYRATARQHVAHRTANPFFSDPRSP
jgi:hypothetical protein